MDLFTLSHSAQAMVREYSLISNLSAIFKQKHQLSIRLFLFKILFFLNKFFLSSRIIFGPRIFPRGSSVIALVLPWSFRPWSVCGLSVVLPSVVRPSVVRPSVLKSFFYLCSKNFEGWGWNFTWSFGKEMCSKSIKMVLVASVIRHKLCMIFAFFDFFCSKSFFDQISFSYCCYKSNYLGSIVYLSWCV